MKHRILAAALAASAALGLSACTTDGYGYGGVNVGYGGGYYDYPYWGWYDDYYYPGVGYYIYDRGGQRHRWSDRQRSYWEARRGHRERRENWSGYRNNSPWRAENQRQGATNDRWRQRRESQRSERREERRREWRSERREERQREWRSERRQSGSGNWGGQRRQQPSGDRGRWSRGDN